MRVSAIQVPSVSACLKTKNKHNPTGKPSNEFPKTTTFKGELGQSGGAALGMLAGVAASFVVGPIAALAISAAGLVSGGFAGDKIEEIINEKGSKN